MKYAIKLFTLFFTVSFFSQTWTETIDITGGMPPIKNINGTNSNLGLVGNEFEWSKISGMLAQFDDIDLVKRNIKGSVYLFDTWDNEGEIFVGKNKYVVNNINFHLEKKALMSQLGKDSTYVYEKNTISKVLVNGRLFKYVVTSNDDIGKFHEIIYEGKNISLLKSFSVSFMERSKNPMVNRPESELKQKSKYYVLKNNELSSFKPKKSSMKPLLEKTNYQNLKLYLDKYNLSFKKEANLTTIFKFCDKL